MRNRHALSCLLSGPLSLICGSRLVYGIGNHQAVPSAGRREKPTNCRNLELDRQGYCCSAAPRTELDELLARDEMDRAGVYILIGSNPLSNAPVAYTGEAEIIRDRLRQHKTREWVSAIVFVSKDENLTKAHVRYLENRLLSEATQINRFTLEQNQAGP